ncbi:MAG: bifunctional diguanylate cyclase/phosphodiesterase, partial [Cetobacterium sp.]|nr:bifunctional diguanylate cyclase/phosphodiesterase [Cetobacterium sp.]
KAEEILDILSAKNKNGKLTRVSASIGIVVGDINEEENIDSLLMKGDLALYKAKEQGKNQYVFYNKYLDQKRCLDLDIEQELRNALAKNELVLYYQPQYDLNRKLVGFEALLRWHNEKFKHIPIIEVIKIMEKYNLIDDIGRFITRSAMEFSRKINENRKRNIVISINISSIQIMKNNFVRKIKKYLGEIGADPKNIGLEITETVLLQNIEENIEKIKELRDIGIKISLDDFGTGYSSFSYLVKLPLNNIKIDKSFVKGMTEAEEYKKLIKLTVDTARALKLNVVGEGVETERDFEILKEIGIDYIQGYLFSKPIPEKEAMELLMKEK